MKLTAVLLFVIACSFEDVTGLCANNPLTVSTENQSYTLYAVKDTTCKLQLDIPAQYNAIQINIIQGGIGTRVNPIFMAGDCLVFGTTSAMNTCDTRCMVSDRSQVSSGFAHLTGGEIKIFEIEYFACSEDSQTRAPPTLSSLATTTTTTTTNSTSPVTAFTTADANRNISTKGLNSTTYMPTTAESIEHTTQQHIIERDADAGLLSNTHLALIIIAVVLLLVSVVIIVVCIRSNNKSKAEEHPGIIDDQSKAVTDHNYELITDDQLNPDKQTVVNELYSTRTNGKAAPYMLAGQSGFAEKPCEPETVVNVLYETTGK